MDVFRPEYVEGLESARWNFWCYVALAFPFFLLVPAAAKRRFGCAASLLSLVGCWLAFSFALNHYWEAKARLAVTEAEIADASSDAGRLFGPLLVGVPVTTVYVLFVSGVVYGVSALARHASKRQEPAPSEHEDYSTYRAALVREIEQLRQDGTSSDPGDSKARRE